MASALQAPKATVGFPAPSASVAGDVKANVGEYNLAAALVINDTIDLCKLPAGHVMVDALVHSDDLDSATSLTMKVDIYDPVTTVLTPVIADGAFGRTAEMKRMGLAGALKLAPVDYDRYLRVTVTAAPGTGATSGAIIGALMYRAGEVLDR